MDRRLLIALALSAVVILLFNVVLAPPSKHALPSAPADSLGAQIGSPQEAESLGHAGATVPVPALTMAGGQAEEEQLTSVTTADFLARFTNRGGRLVSWELSGYAGPTGNVQILRAGEGEFGLVLETPQGPLSLDEILYRVEETQLGDGSHRIRYQAGMDQGLQVVKTYTLPPRGYLADLTVELAGAGDATGYRLVWQNGIPPAEKNTKFYQLSVATVALLGKDRHKIRPGAFRREPRKDLEGNVRWAGVKNKYFGALMIPPEGMCSRVVATGDRTDFVTGAELALPLLQGAAQHDFKLYLGPLDFNRLKASGHGLEQAVELGWKVFRPVSQFLLITMGWMYRIIPNFGVVIILLSALTKAIFYPLTRSSVRSMKAMQRLQPQMQTLRDKYKNDPQRMNQAVMGLYREHKVNPFGGCLPMVVQMPVFIGLYQVLANDIAMRGAKFMLWINDLSVPETLFTVGTVSIHALPIVMLAAGLIQQKLTPTGDPRQKMMGYMMPAMMLFIFYSFPAGLNLYWTVNTILTAGQQWWIHRQEPVATSAPAAA